MRLGGLCLGRRKAGYDERYSFDRTSDEWRSWESKDPKVSSKQFSVHSYSI